MMFGKALLFGDGEIAGKIMETQDPRSAKKLGRAVKGFSEPVWVAQRKWIDLLGNIHRIPQNPAIAGLLCSTGSAILAEASPYDKVWGIGVKASDPRARQPDQWPGLNLLGSVLTEVRDYLKPNSARNPSFVLDAA